MSIPAAELVTEVRVKLVPNPDRPDRLAVIDFRIGPLVIRGTRVIQKPDGSIKLAFADMPIVAPCGDCGTKIARGCRYCRYCGAAQPGQAPLRNARGQQVRYNAIVFPVGHRERAELERLLLGAYLAELGVRPRLFVPAVGA